MVTSGPAVHTTDGRISRRRRLAGVVACVGALVLSGCAGAYSTPASSVSDTGATLNGLVFDPYDATISYWFAYGPSTAYGSETAHQSLSITDRANHPVSADVTGLTSGTTYHYAVCSKDPNAHPPQDPGNQVVCGGDQTFTTSDATISQLSITASPALSPAFDPEVSDYVTRCTSSPVVVSVEAPSATTVAVAGQPARSGRFTQGVALTPGRRFSFTTTASGGSSRSYTVRCLPSDFPAFTWAKPGTPSAHFYITTPQSVKAPDGSTAARYVAIYDADGVPVWWRKATGTDAKLLPDGTIGWYTPGIGTTPVSGFETHRLDGTLVKTWRTVGSATDIHDFQPLSNGNALMVSYPPRPGTQDLSAYGGAATGGTLIDGAIQEIDSSGNLIWQWNSKDHVTPAETPARWKPFVWDLPSSLPDGRKGYDYVHLNSIQQVGNTVVASFRHLDAVLAINKTTGDTIWKLGGTRTSQSLTVKNDPESNTSPLGGQHYARVLSDGTLTLHDNNTNQTGVPPRAVRYSINKYDDTATWLQQVVDPDVTSSSCCGSAQRLDDGSYVMSWGGTPVISEFGPTGNRHFKLAFQSVDGGFGFSYRVDPITGSNPTIGELRAGMDAMP